MGRQSPCYRNIRLAALRRFGNADCELIRAELDHFWFARAGLRPYFDCHQVIGDPGAMSSGKNKTTGAFGPDAASTIPWLSIPIIALGSRFATSATFFPTSVS